MAANSNNEYKMFKYYEGLCSSANFTKEIAKVLSLGVKEKAIMDTDGNTIAESEIVQAKNWDIVYPVCDSTINWVDKNGQANTYVFQVDPVTGLPTTTGLSNEIFTQKILNQVNKISDTVILKTTTTPKEIDDEDFDELTVDSSSNEITREMYLEIYKPTYIANPEEYPLDCERMDITPQVITKDLYRKAYAVTESTEDTIYLDTDICEKEMRTQEESGDVSLSKEECNSYLEKMCNITSNPGFIRLPVDTDASSVEEGILDKSYLTKIKQQDAELYSFISNTLRGSEGGIEPKEYSKLSKLKIEVRKELQDNGEESYFVGLKGSIEKTIYSISKGEVYSTKKNPNAMLTPEFYLNGVYIPLDTTKYHVADNNIFFDENITFEAETDGVLVVRYAYNTVSNPDTISERTTLLNNHYVLMRLFDEINDSHSGPKDNIYNASGEVIKTNSHVSPWSKLSWYQDFEEVMVDTIDSDVGLSNLQDGTKFVPLETAGLNSDTKMRYYINANNDRFSLIVMGNPSLDYERDRHLISGCYCGRIDSFENSINDTAGNFALFTCSSTEPCDTTIKSSKEEILRGDEIITLKDLVELANEDLIKSAEEIINKKSGFSADYTSGRTQYEVQLNDKTYFDRSDWPKYIIAEVSEKEDGSYEVEKYLTGLNSLQASPNWIMENGKANSAVFTIRTEDSVLEYSGTCKVFFYFGYYTEKYVITSGIARDVFGNVIDVEKVKTYGKNTSDGVTSIMMYHTRSKAYYQKHHMLFATTEEYMSKVMYGKSSYTGEYYADRIKVTHGNDGPRGTLSDLLVIDSASLYALDELVINKDFKVPDESEETFVFFPITAPYSPLSDSPNATYGFAIKKSEIEPEYLDESKIVQIAVNQLKAIYTDRTLDSSIGLIDTTDNKCSVFWKVVKDSAWYGNKDTKATYDPLVIAIPNSSKYSGDNENKLSPDNELILEPSPTAKTDKNCSVSTIVAKNFTARSGEKIYYGISDTPVTEINQNAHLYAVFYDGAQDDTSDDDNGGWVYNLDGVPYTACIGEELPPELEIVNASPNKYLVVYSAKEEETPASSGVERTKTVKITGFDCKSLKSPTGSPNSLLKYPSTINVSTGGEGKIINIIDNQNSTDYVTYIHTVVLYETEIKVPMVPENGWAIGDIKAIYADGTEKSLDVVPNVKDGIQGVVIPAAEITQDIRIEISFVKQ